MPIVRNGYPNKDGIYPTGAFIRLGDRIPIVEEFVGLCLFETERNMHDDSDFFMTVWNDEKGEPERHMFATTRFACTVEFSSKPDATPEIREKYAAWLAKVEAEEKERKLREYRVKMWETLRRFRRMEGEVAILYGVPKGSIIRLRKGYGGLMIMGCRKDGDYEAVLNLLISKRIRSNFKLNLRRQVVEWLKNPEPDYNRPLSPRQMDCI